MSPKSKSISLVMGVMVLAIAGGLVRLLFDSPNLPPVDVQTAVGFATTCFPESEIPANMPVSVATLPLRDPGTGTISPPPAREFIFEATEAIPVEPLNTELRAKLNQGGTVNLPKDTEVRVSRGEFTIAQGSVEIRRSGTRSFLLRVTDPLRFKQVENATYIVRLNNDVELAAGPRNLPAGTRGTLSIPTGQLPVSSQQLERQPISLVPIQPLAVRPWLIGTAHTLSPSRAAGQRGLNNLGIEARQPGYNFASAGLALNACGWAEGDAPRVVGIAETTPNQLGAATVILTMPSNILPTFSSITGLKWWNSVKVAVASSDGQYMAYGGFTAIDRGWAAIISTLLVAVLFVGIFNLRFQEVGDTRKPWQSWFAGLFIGPDRDPSLSLFQIFFWTVITVWGLAYVYIVTGTLLGMTTSMMALLGIAGTGSVLARWIGAGTSTSSPQAESASPQQSSPISDSTQPFDIGQMLSTNGNFDLLKLQLFIFTIMIGAYVVWRITDAAAFPELDANTLLLLGVSQGLYIGGKLTGTSTLTRAQTFKLDLDLRTSEKTKIEAELDSLNKRKSELDKKGAGQLTQEEQTEMARINADLKLAQERLGAVNTKINLIKDDLNKSIQSLGLTS